MKHLLLFCLLAGSLRAAGQPSPWRLPLPVDSASGRITYTGVVVVPGASQDELYSRAREWFAATFGSSKAVLEMDDRAVGKLIGRAYAEFEMASGLGRSTSAWAMWRNIKVEVKPDRYRYTLTRFELGGPAATPVENVRPMEGWLARTIAGGKPPGKLVQSAIDGVKETAEAEAASLQRAMTRKGSPDKDF